jgi:hypothetical protein
MPNVDQLKARTLKPYLSRAQSCNNIEIMIKVAYL